MTNAKEGFLEWLDTHMPQDIYRDDIRERLEKAIVIALKEQAKIIFEDIESWSDINKSDLFWKLKEKWLK